MNTRKQRSGKRFWHNTKSALMRSCLLLLPILVLVSSMRSSTLAWSGEQSVSFVVAKLDTALQTLVTTEPTGTREHVQLTISAPDRRQIVAAVTAVGGEITGSGNEGTVLQGWLPDTALQMIAAREDVVRIRRPPIADQAGEITAGNLTTEGFGLMNGPAWHAAGYTGAGVRIGVIDTAFAGYAPLRGTELPAQLTARNFVDGQTLEQFGNGDDPHGTACAEIIHDIAPDAALFLAKIQTQLDLEEAVDWLIAQQVDVISTSTLWWNETPGDGTGWLANVVRRAQNAGILFVAAAGNERQLHWGGTFFDPDLDTKHNFSGTVNINALVDTTKNPEEFALVPAGTTIQLYLRWDDWTQVTQDYDLHLVQSFDGSQWNFLRSSLDRQTGAAGQTPTEQILWNTTGAPAYYGVMITRFLATRPVNFELFVRGPHMSRTRLNLFVPARSLANLSDAPDVFTVSTVREPKAPFQQAPYSAEGPTNGPGGTASGGATTKPDISGYTYVSTATLGSGDSRFIGTSAAAPHVAGAAALVVSANPGWTPAQIKAFLRGRATDLGAPGHDTAFGAGVLNLGAPPATAPKFKAFLPAVRSQS